jgi:hypothetical protein
MATIFAQLGYILKTVIPVTVKNGVLDCPNVIVVGPKKSMNLKWSIQDGALYEITGITFDPPGNPEFVDFQKDGIKNYKCKNKMKIDKTHKYTIEVTPVGGGAKIVLDPMIRNEPH